MRATSGQPPSSDFEIMSRPEVRAAYIDSYRSAPSTSARGRQDFALFAKDWDFRLEDITARVDLWRRDDDRNVPISWIPPSGAHPRGAYARLPRSRTPGRSRPPRRDSADGEFSQPPIARPDTCSSASAWRLLSTLRLPSRGPDASSSASSRPRGPGVVASRCASPPDADDRVVVVAPQSGIRSISLFVPGVHRLRTVALSSSSNVTRTLAL